MCGTGDGNRRAYPERVSSGGRLASIIPRMATRSPSPSDTDAPPAGNEDVAVAVLRQFRQVFNAVKAHFQHVELDADQGTQVGVREGLNEGDQVIATPGERLTEGTAVAVVTGR